MVCVAGWLMVEFELLQQNIVITWKETKRTLIIIYRVIGKGESRANGSLSCIWLPTTKRGPYRVSHFESIFGRLDGNLMKIVINTKSSADYEQTNLFLTFFKKITQF